MTEQFHDLKFERLDDGTVRLEQWDIDGESFVIHAHPAQIIHIARTLAGADPTADMVAVQKQLENER